MILALNRTKVQMSTPFLELDPDIMYTCLICPCPAFCECFLTLLFHSPKMWGLLRPKYPNKNTITQISDGKKIASLKARQGHTKSMCKISGSYLSKTAWTLASVVIVSFMLEPDCMYPSGTAPPPATRQQATQLLDGTCTSMSASCCCCCCRSALLLL